jgi:hypothetical protein
MVINQGGEVVGVCSARGESESTELLECMKVRECLEELVYMGEWWGGRVM